MLARMSMGKRIRELRERLGLSQEKLGEAVGVSYGAVQNWESDTNEPRGKRMDKLAAALQTTKAYLYGLEDELVQPDSPRSSVPLISWIAAGHFHEAIDLHEPGVADEWIPVRGRTGPRAFALTVIGDSMVSPHGPRSYPPGTIIIVDPDVSPTPGRRVVARLTESEEVTFKELAHDAGVNYLKPLNPQYRMIEINEDWEIIGVVVASYQSET